MSKRKQNVQPYWRPNFRIATTLPDIKVIRTDFIINSIAVVLVLIVGFLVAQRELKARSLNETIRDLETKIALAEPADRDFLKLSERFRSSARHVEELQKFYSSPLLAHEFLVDLAEVKPKDLIFSRITYSEAMKTVGKKTSVEYSVGITGQVKELPILTEFKTRLQSADFLKYEGFETLIDESIQSPDPNTRIFPYRVSVALQPATPAKKAAAK